MLKPTAENHGEFWWVKNKDRLEVVQIWADKLELNWNDGDIAFFWIGDEIEEHVSRRPDLVWLGKAEPPKVEED